MSARQLNQAMPGGRGGAMRPEITARGKRRLGKQRALARLLCLLALAVGAAPSQCRLAAAAAAAAAAVGAASSPGERPRLIPLVAAESGYSENSSVNLLCTVSQGHHESLQFDWFKDGQALASGSDSLDDSSPPSPEAPQIEKHADHSLLRIARVQARTHAGRYTCAAKSQFGQDSSSVSLLVNVKLQWIKEPAREIVVSLNQELRLDCLAQGEPKPVMRWEKHESLQGALISGSGGRQQQQPASGSRHRQQAAGQLGPGATSTSAAAVVGANHYHIMELPAGASSGSGRNQLAGLNNNNNKQGGHHYLNSGSALSDALQSSASSSSSNNEVPSQSQTSSSSSSSSSSGNLLVSSSRYLTIQRAREFDAGTYECVASNGHDADLRKLVHVQVRGK